MFFLETVCKIKIAFRKLSFRSALQQILFHLEDAPVSKPAIEVSPESTLALFCCVASADSGKPVALVQPPGADVGFDHIQPQFGGSQNLVGEIPGPVQQHRSHTLAPIVWMATDPFDKDLHGAFVVGAELQLARRHDTIVVELHNTTVFQLGRTFLVIPLIPGVIVLKGLFRKGRRL